MAESVKIEKNTKIWSLLFSVLLLSFYALYIALRIEPKLVYQMQEPVFFFDAYFLSHFFNHPGGINELVSQFLSHFFYFSWSGAIVLIALFAGVAWNVRALLKSISGQSTVFLHWLPTIFLLALHNDYDVPLVFTLGFFVALTSANLFIRFASTKNVLRFVLLIVLHTALYYVVAGQAFIFAIIVIIHEILKRRQITLPILYLVFAGLLPFIGTETVFPAYIRDAYAFQITHYMTYTVSWLSWALYASIPFVLLWAILWSKYFNAETKPARVSIIQLMTNPRASGARVVYLLLFMALTISLAWYTFDPSAKILLRVDYGARHEKWNDVLEIAKEKDYISHSFIQYEANRALYLSGHLSDGLFSIRQYFRGDGLFLYPGLYKTYPLQHGDVFFDLGLINESEHWTYEALTLNGDSPWNLQRLAQIYLLEGNTDAAKRFLEKLQKTMWFKKWATQYMAYLDDPEFSTSDRLRELKSLIPQTDFLVPPMTPALTLEQLLQNPDNKMAFEYYMAYCLLEGKLEQFIQNLYRLNAFNYPVIPRHFEEAILIYMQLTGRRDIPLPGRTISENTVRRFVDFNQTLQKHNKNRAEAFAELEQKHQDTYWFYALYYFQTEER